MVLRKWLIPRKSRRIEEESSDRSGKKISRPVPVTWTDDTRSERDGEVEAWTCFYGGLPTACASGVELMPADFKGAGKATLHPNPARRSFEDEDRFHLEWKRLTRPWSSARVSRAAGRCGLGKGLELADRIAKLEEHVVKAHGGGITAR